MKKILLIHHANKIGGGTKSLIDLYNILKINYNVKVLLPFNKNDEVNNYFDCKDLIFVKYVGSINIYNGGPRFYQFSFFNGIKNIKSSKKTIIKILDDLQPDLLIFNSLVISWLGWGLKKFIIPKICIVRETSPGFLSIFIFKILFKFINKVIYISDYDKNSYRLKKPLYSITIRDSYLPFKQKLDLPSNSFQKNKINVLFLGGESSLKGWQTVKEAIKILQNNTIIHFNIAGIVNENKKILQNNVSYLGLKNSTYELYEKSDILIFPSSKAHQARPIFEAGYHSLPVIVSDFKPNQEQVHQGINGILIKPNSAYELTRAIIFLSENEKLRNRMGKNNFSFYLKFNNYKKNMNIINKIIKKELFKND
jgi:glycosyltransferase involved in cell wall biosynthesis